MAPNDSTVFGDYSELHVPHTNATAETTQKLSRQVWITGIFLERLLIESIKSNV